MESQNRGLSYPLLSPADYTGFRHHCATRPEPFIASATSYFLSGKNIQKHGDAAQSVNNLDQLRLSAVDAKRAEGFLQPFLDQADDAPVADPMLQEADQLFLADLVEERSVSVVQYVAHLLAVDASRRVFIHCSIRPL